MFLDILNKYNTNKKKKKQIKVRSFFISSDRKKKKNGTTWKRTTTWDRFNNETTQTAKLKLKSNVNKYCDAQMFV